MTRALWMPGVHRRSLMNRAGGSHNTVSGWVPRGVVLHVNDSPVGSRGTSIDWYAAGGGSASVCPTWQVYPDGETWQLLTAAVQPWCQRDGNAWGLAIETGGNHAEPLTPAALTACAAIVRWVHDEWGVPLRIADSPSERGLGTHQMGGAAWGGHACPGTIRARQRQQIINLAAGGHAPAGGGTQLEDDVSKTDVIDALKSAEGQRLVARAVLAYKGTDDAGPDTWGLLNQICNVLDDVPHDVWAYDEGGKTRQAWGFLQAAADPGKFATAVLAGLPPASKGGLTVDQVEQAVRAALDGATIQTQED